MKTIKLTQSLITLIVFGVITSCSNTQENTNKSENTLTQYSDTLNPYSGSWISKEYFKVIKETGSPKQAQDGSTFITIPEKLNSPTIMIFNFHEGGGELRFVNAENGYQMWMAQKNELTKKVGDVTRISEFEIKIGDQAYIKINPLKDERFFKILEEILFSGNFTDSTSRRIKFNKDGTLKGLRDYKFYDPHIDYIDAGMQVDQVGLGQTKGQYDWYGFTFNNDTLSLYELNCLTLDSINNRCLEVENGKLAFKIWKEKN